MSRPRRKIKTKKEEMENSTVLAEQSAPGEGNEDMGEETKEKLTGETTESKDEGVQNQSTEVPTEADWKDKLRKAREEEEKRYAAEHPAEEEPEVDEATLPDAKAISAKDSKRLAEMDNPDKPGVFYSSAPTGVNATYDSERDQYTTTVEGSTYTSYIPKEVNIVYDDEEDNLPAADKAKDEKSAKHSFGATKKVEAETKKPETETRKAETEAKKPEPEAKKPEAEAKKMEEKKPSLFAKNTEKKAKDKATDQTLAKATDSEIQKEAESFQYQTGNIEKPAEESVKEEAIAKDEKLSESTNEKETAALAEDSLQASATVISATGPSIVEDSIKEDSATEAKAEEVPVTDAFPTGGEEISTFAPTMENTEEDNLVEADVTTADLFGQEAGDRNPVGTENAGEENTSYMASQPVEDSLEIFEATSEEETDSSVQNPDSLDYNENTETTISEAVEAEDEIETTEVEVAKEEAAGPAEVTKPGKGKKGSVKSSKKIKATADGKKEKSVSPKKGGKIKTNAKGDVPLVKRVGFRLVLSFLIPVVCIVVLGVVSYEKASNALTESYETSTTQTADMMQQFLSMIISTEKENYKGYLTEEAILYYYKGLYDKETMITTKNNYIDTFRNNLARDSKLDNVFILSDDGNSIYKANMQVVDDAYTQFKNSTEGQAVLESAYDWHMFGVSTETDEAVNIDSSKYAIRLVRKFNDMPQAMVVDVSASSVRTALQSLDPGEGGYVCLVVDDGTEFYSDAEIAFDQPLIYGTDFYNEAWEAEEADGYKMVSIDGEEFLFVYNKLEVGDSMVVALIPESEVLAATSSIKTVSVVLTLIAAVIALLLGYFMSSSMTGTIKYILRQLRKVSKGDLTVQLVPKSGDEFGLLCEGVNDTVGHVKDLIVNVNEVSGQLNEAAGYVKNASATFMVTSHDIQNAVSEIEIGVNKLDTGSEDCLNQMDSLSGKITNVSTNTDEIGKLTASTGTTINFGIETVQGLTSSAASTTEITRNVIVAIEDLEKKSKSISKIVSAINEIAEQTNLLSLNASIEAARAGESGKGFAVVAEEIRKLSDQCLNSAGQINDIVQEIVSKTGEVVGIAKQAEEVVSTQAGAVDATTLSFRQIDQQVESLISALGTISSNVQEMNTSRSETLGAIESISAVSAETAACSSSVIESTGSQLEAVKDLDYASKQLAERSEKLIEMLNTFTV